MAPCRTSAESRHTPGSTSRLPPRLSRCRPGTVRRLPSSTASTTTRTSRSQAVEPSALVTRRGAVGGHAAVALRFSDGSRPTTAFPTARSSASRAVPGSIGRDERARRRDARHRTGELRRRRDRRRRDLRPARHALRAPARTGNESREGGGTEGRPLVRAGDDGDPHPRADPGQAGRRRGSPERLAEPRHAR